MVGKVASFWDGFLAGAMLVSGCTFCEKASMCHVSIRLSRANVIRPNFGFLPFCGDVRCANQEMRKSAEAS